MSLPTRDGCEAVAVRPIAADVYRAAAMVRASQERRVKLQRLARGRHRPPVGGSVTTREEG